MLVNQLQKLTLNGVISVGVFATLRAGSTVRELGDCLGRQPGGAKSWQV